MQRTCRCRCCTAIVPDRSDVAGAAITGSPVAEARVAALVDPDSSATAAELEIAEGRACKQCKHRAAGVYLFRHASPRPAREGPRTGPSPAFSMVVAAWASTVLGRTADRSRRAPGVHLAHTEGDAIEVVRAHPGEGRCPGVDEQVTDRHDLIRPLGAYTCHAECVPSAAYVPVAPAVSPTTSKEQLDLNPVKSDRDGRSTRWGGGVEESRREESMLSSRIGGTRSSRTRGLTGEVSEEREWEIEWETSLNARWFASVGIVGRRDPAKRAPVARSNRIR